MTLTTRTRETTKTNKLNCGSIHNFHESSVEMCSWVSSCFGPIHLLSMHQTYSLSWQGTITLIPPIILDLPCNQFTLNKALPPPHKTESGSFSLEIVLCNLLAFTSPHPACKTEGTSPVCSFTFSLCFSLYGVCSSCQLRISRC